MWYHVYLVAIDIAFYVITYRLLQMQQHVFSGLVVYKLELEYIPRAKGIIIFDVVFFYNYHYYHCITLHKIIVTLQ